MTYALPTIARPKYKIREITETSSSHPALFRKNSPPSILEPYHVPHPTTLFSVKNPTQKTITPPATTKIEPKKGNAGRRSDDDGGTKLAHAIRNTRTSTKHGGLKWCAAAANIIKASAATRCSAKRDSAELRKNYTFPSILEKEEKPRDRVKKTRESE